MPLDFPGRNTNILEFSIFIFLSALKAHCAMSLHEGVKLWISSVGLWGWETLFCHPRNRRPDQKLFWVIYPKVEWIKVDALMRYKVKLFFRKFAFWYVLFNMYIQLFFLSFILVFGKKSSYNQEGWKKISLQIFQRIEHKYASSPDRQLLLIL